MIMRKNVTILCLFAAFSIGCGIGGNSALSAQATHATSVNNLNITGEIALMGQGYIIRGKVPAEIFTILNPNPDVLDKIIAKGKDVDVSVRVVSGDNVEIEQIDGKEYK
jgi:hypothetical protein